MSSYHWYVEIPIDNKNYAFGYGRSPEDALGKAIAKAQDAKQDEEGDSPSTSTELNE